MEAASALLMCVGALASPPSRGGRLLARVPPPPNILVYTSEVCIGHDPGLRFGRPLPEKPERLSRLIEAARGDWATEFGERMELRSPEADVTEEQLLR